MSATFDEMPESASNEIENFSVKLVNSEARTVEIFDKDTGHSIANRVLDANDQTEVVGYEISFTGRGSDEVFLLKKMQVQWERQECMGNCRPAMSPCWKAVKFWFPANV